VLPGRSSVLKGNRLQVACSLYAEEDGRHRLRVDSMGLGSAGFQPAVQHNLLLPGVVYLHRKSPASVSVSFAGWHWHALLCADRAYPVTRLARTLQSFKRITDELPAVPVGISKEAW